MGCSHKKVSPFLWPPAAWNCRRHCYFVMVYGWVKGPLREGPVTTSPRSRSMENVADAKLEKTSLSADVLQGVPFVPGPSLRYAIGGRRYENSWV